METKYRFIRADGVGYYYKHKLPKSMTFEELKEQIADAFYKRIKTVRLYTDGRKRNSYLEVQKEQFDKSFIEESYKKMQRQNEIDYRLKAVENLKLDIAWKEKRIKEIEAEIQSLNLKKIT